MNKKKDLKDAEDVMRKERWGDESMYYRRDDGRECWDGENEKKAVPILAQPFSFIVKTD